MIDGDRLRQIRKDYLSDPDPEKKREKTAKLLKDMGISSMNFIFKLERDGSTAKAETLFKLADALNCQPWELVNDELMNSLIPDKEFDEIVYSKLQRYLSEEDKAKIPERYKKLLSNKDLVSELKQQIFHIDVSRPAGESKTGCPTRKKFIPMTASVSLPYPNCEAIEVVNDSLEPYLRKGDILVVSHDYKSWKNGDLCEISIFGERYVRRVFEFNSDYSFYHFQSLIPSYENEHATPEQVEWIYKVVAIIKN